MTDESTTYQDFYKTQTVEPPKYDSNPRIQFLDVPDGTYVLVIDNWDGLGNSPEWAEGIKEATGASGVLFFSCKIDIL